MASDGLKGCVFEMNLADPHNDEAAFGQSKLITEDVQGKTCLRFPWYGSYLLQNVLDGQKVADHDWSLLISMWFICSRVCFTKKRINHIQKTSYAQHQQVHQIHKKMMEIMTWEVQTNDLKEDVNKLIPDSTGKDREKAFQPIFPLHDVFVRKVKMLKKAQVWSRKTQSYMVKAVVLEKLLGMRQVLKLNKLMDTSQQPKNLFKMQTFNGDRQKILSVV